MFKGYVRVKKEIIYNKDLTVNERLILIVLIDRQEYALSTGKDSFYCYVGWIAESVGVSEKTVKNCIKKLKKAGYIDYTLEKYECGYRNVYTVNDKLLVEGEVKITKVVG